MFLNPLAAYQFGQIYGQQRPPPTSSGGYATAAAALQALAQALREHLEAQHDVTFAPYGGACVLAEDDASEMTGRPTVEMSVADDRASEVVQVRGARECDVQVLVISDDFSGARVGAANIQSSISLLTRALADFVRENASELRGLGLYRVRFQKGARQLAGDETAGEIFDPHSISFLYFTPEHPATGHPHGQ